MMVCNGSIYVVCGNLLDGSVVRSDGRVMW